MHMRRLTAYGGILQLMEQVRVVEVEVLLFRAWKRHRAGDVVDQDIAAEQLLHDLEKQWMAVNLLVKKRAFELRG
jgi:hypothetical protein